MLQKGQEMNLALILVLCTLAMVVFVISFFIFFRRYRQKIVQNLKEKESLRSQFQQTLLQSQLEIREQTFKHISQEIHDNIGQMLSLAKLNLATTNFKDEAAAERKVQDAHELVAKSILDLRNLSRSFDTDYISGKGIQQSIAFELELIERAGNHKTQLTLLGEPVKLDKQKELILFRIIQECFNNILRHAQAAQITVQISYLENAISLKITDDGHGFDNASTDLGLGLRNMHNRAALIGASFSITSLSGNGTTVNIELPLS